MKIKDIQRIFIAGIAMLLWSCGTTNLPPMITEDGCVLFAQGEGENRYIAGFCQDGRWLAQWSQGEIDLRLIRREGGTVDLSYRNGPESPWITWTEESGIRINWMPYIPREQNQIAQ